MLLETAKKLTETSTSVLKPSKSVTCLQMLLKTFEKMLEASTSVLNFSKEF